MKVQFDINAENFEASQKLHFKSPAASYITTAVIMILPLIGLLVGFSVPLVVAFWFGFAAYALFSQLYMVYLSKKIVSQTPSWQPVSQYEISEEGIQSSGSFGMWKYNWSFFTKAKYNENLLVLYPGTSAAFYIFPRKGFSEEEWKNFVELVKTKVPDTTK